uniref:Uncharacterized protein n=1 Tax=Desertifilum tharense IPPAS B-1220 TaxID=1781255 RepID=A0ACD5H0K8_9CYAN
MLNPSSRRANPANSAYFLLFLTILFWSGNTIVGTCRQYANSPVGLAFWRWFCSFVLILLPSWRYLKQDWYATVAPLADGFVTFSVRSRVV